MRRYRLGAAEVASEIALSGLPDAAGVADVVICIRRGAPADGLEWLEHPEGSELTPDWAKVEYWRSSDGGWYRLRYDYRGHVADFGIRSDGCEITVQAGEGETDAEIANLIEGPILGRALRLAGRPCVHATALAAEGRAIALMGASGVGKSSLAWALIDEGCRLVTDDLVGLVGDADGFLVQPGRARLRMWPDSARRLGVSDATATTLFPTTTEMAKVSVHDPARFQATPVRLHAIYRMTPRIAGLAEPLIEDLPPGERLAELAANLIGMITPGREQRRQELSLLARVAAATPIRTLSLPDDLDALPAMAALLRRRLFA